MFSLTKGSMRSVKVVLIFLGLMNADCFSADLYRQMAPKYPKVKFMGGNVGETVCFYPATGNCSEKVSELQLASPVEAFVLCEHQCTCCNPGCSSCFNLMPEQRKYFIGPHGNNLYYYTWDDAWSKVCGVTTYKNIVWDAVKMEVNPGGKYEVRIGKGVTPEGKEVNPITYYSRENSASTDIIISFEFKAVPGVKK